MKAEGELVLVEKRKYQAEIRTWGKGGVALTAVGAIKENRRWRMAAVVEAVMALLGCK